MNACPVATVRWTIAVGCAVLALSLVALSHHGTDRAVAGTVAGPLPLPVPLPVALPAPVLTPLPMARVAMQAAGPRPAPAPTPVLQAAPAATPHPVAVPALRPRRHVADGSRAAQAVAQGGVILLLTALLARAWQVRLPRPRRGLAMPAAGK